MIQMLECLGIFSGMVASGTTESLKHLKVSIRGIYLWAGEMVRLLKARLTTKRDICLWLSLSYKRTYGLLFLLKGERNRKSV